MSDRMIGVVINNYRIVDVLDRSGGMGIVYRAVHVTMGQRAVIKQLYPQYSQNPSMVARFLNEARAAAAIDDPGIVKIFDQGTLPDGSAYITMEHLPGTSLRGHLRQATRVAPDLAVAFIRQAARAVGAAHRMNIVHRDLKPENLFLCPDPDVPEGARIKVLDFGIAKLVDSPIGTQTGTQMGTPAYMGPEQWRNAKLADARSDIYSLGCILFEMLTGRTPFLGPAIPDFMDQHRFREPPLPSSIDQSLAAFDHVIQRSLAKSLDDRFAAIDDFVAALPRGMHTTPLPAPPATPVRQATAPADVSSSLPVSTTLSSAAASISSAAPATPRPRKRTTLLALSAVAAVAAIVGVAAVVASGRDRGAGRGEADAGASFPGGPGGTAGAPSGPAVTPTGPPPTPALQTAVAELGNRWIAVAPPARPVVLGIRTDDPRDTVSGFRPRRHVEAPSRPFEIQAHEVTWAEIKPWLEQHPQAKGVVAPPPTTDAEGLRRPAVGLPWASARDYCASLGATLPTEEQWEYAARGSELRPHPWGTARLDLGRTHAYAGPNAATRPVMTSDQDVTPGGPAERIYDLAGNAQEWTLDLWREDEPGQDESWVQEGDTSFRALRGLPLASASPAHAVEEGAAYREPLCATGVCLPKAANHLRTVGFRCARAK